MNLSLPFLSKNPLFPTLTFLACLLQKAGAESSFTQTDDINSQVSMKKTSLLLADGDLIETYALSRFLTQHGFQVETAMGGLDCLKKLRRSPFEVLVLNLELPWGGGEGVLALLREEPDLGRIPVLLTSATASPKELARHLNGPVVRAILKPFSWWTLKNEILLVLGNSGLFQEKRLAKNPLTDVCLDGKVIIPQTVV